jgi:hypothetical protein
MRVGGEASLNTGRIRATRKIIVEDREIQVVAPEDLILSKLNRRREAKVCLAIDF